MIFDDIHNARSWFLDYVDFDKSLVESFYSNTSLGKGWKFGDYILLQHIQNYKISRPIYGIFTSFTIWDQALVLQMVENKRAWMYSNKIKSENIDSSFYICTLDDEITQFEFWTGDIYLLGHWTRKPSVSELRESLKKQVRDTSYNREQSIKKILNG
jgi:hypothetical protein